MKRNLNEQDFENKLRTAGDRYLEDLEQARPDSKTEHAFSAAFERRMELLLHDVDEEPSGQRAEGQELSRQQALREQRKDQGRQAELNHPAAQAPQRKRTDQLRRTPLWAKAAVAVLAVAIIGLGSWGAVTAYRQGQVDRQALAKRYVELKEAGRLEEALAVLKKIHPDTKTRLEDLERQSEAAAKADGQAEQPLAPGETVPAPTAPGETTAVLPTVDMAVLEQPFEQRPLLAEQFYQAEALPKLAALLGKREGAWSVPYAALDREHLLWAQIATKTGYVRQLALADAASGDLRVLYQSANTYDDFQLLDLDAGDLAAGCLYYSISMPGPSELYYRLPLQGRLEPLTKNEYQAVLKERAASDERFAVVEDSAVKDFPFVLRDQKEGKDLLRMRLRPDIEGNEQALLLDFSQQAQTRSFLWTQGQLYRLPETIEGQTVLLYTLAPDGTLFAYTGVPKTFGLMPMVDATGIFRLNRQGR